MGEPIHTSTPLPEGEVASAAKKKNGNIRTILLMLLRRNIKKNYFINVIINANWAIFNKNIKFHLYF